MKTLGKIVPSAEQLKLITNPRPGVFSIRGAAGSGKTTTALLMLDQLSNFWVRQKTRNNTIDEGVNVLVLTFNRTLSGYIANLAQSQISGPINTNLTVSTLAKWALNHNDTDINVDDKVCSSQLRSLSIGFRSAEGFSLDFILSEIEYVLGRFTEDALDSYCECKRVGRGNSPQMVKHVRNKLLRQVIQPYLEWKREEGILDWNDIPNKLLLQRDITKYDIIIADEAQDFSANQIRAIMHYSADPSSVIFVLDAAQRIYPRGCSWLETGVSLKQSFRLSQNHRNTKEICAFAAPILMGLEIEDDGTIPNLNSCQRGGTKPRVIKGKYSQQLEYCIHYINKYVDLTSESVAFLKPRGGNWFREIKTMLSRKSLPFVEITRESEWPAGSENIALSTMHSAKGLEFDHVFIIGLNQEVTPHGNETGDNDLENLRRLLAMAITRARTSVIVGYKPDEASSLISYFNPETFIGIDL